MPRHNHPQQHILKRPPGAFPLALLSLPLLISACGGGGSSGNNTASSSPSYKTLTAEVIVPMGSNCDFGGLAEETGQDTNRDGELDSNEVDPTKTQYTCNAAGAITLGGSVSGLPGDGSQSVTLQNLGADDLMMSLDYSYTFTTGLAEGSIYLAAVTSQPSARQCEFADYSESVSGTLGNSNLTDLDLTCYEDRQVITFAGSSQGFADGTGTAAKFALPYGIAADTNGNVYVADDFNNRIRKITSAGKVSTLAGSTAGTLDGTGSAAQFDSPRGIAVDASGNLYVADTDNHRIRKITPAGEVSTLAGSTAGKLDGTGSAAQFNLPKGIAVDASGNLYVADTYNHRIRKVTPAGEVSTLAGSSPGNADGTGIDAQFNYPIGIAVDASGNLYVADTFNNRIRKITPDGVVSTLAGSSSGYADGTGTAAKFNGPNDIAMDASGNLYVAEFNNHHIRKITAAGEVSTLAGSTGGKLDGTGTAAQFANPAGIAMDANGNLFVADTNNNRIRKIYLVP